MSVERALEVLGLTGTPSQQEIRRAYLRKVKEHPPERDREGFERIRQAFEFLKSGMGDAIPPRAAPRAEPPATATPEIAFPPSSFQPQLDRVHEALDADDPVAGAQAMIELYELPASESAPVAPPLLCFQTFMALMARNRFEVGRKLLAAFERHASLNGLESGMAPEVGARWALAREVAALSPHEEAMTRAVAQSLGGGHIYTAAYAAQDAYDRGVELERIMRQYAPTIWTALAPHLKTTRAEVERATGFRFPRWALGLAMVSALRFCNVFTDTASDLDLAAPQTDQRAPAARLPEREDLTPSPASKLTFRERAQLEIDGHWRPIADLAEHGDCAGVRDRWPQYAKAAASPDVVNRPTAAARRKLVLEKCADLTDLFDEP
jgi:hypothetical protein